MATDTPTAKNPTAVRLGKQLAELRTQCGLTTRSLAEQAGSSKAMVYNVEHGKCSASVDTLEQLLAPLGYRLDIVDDMD